MTPKEPELCRGIQAMQTDGRSTRGKCARCFFTIDGMWPSCRRVFARKFERSLSKSRVSTSHISVGWKDSAEMLQSCFIDGGHWIRALRPDSRARNINEKCEASFTGHVGAPSDNKVTLPLAWIDDRCNRGLSLTTMQG